MYIAYDLWMAGSIVLCALLFTLTAQRKLKCWALGAASLLFAVPLGAIGAKLVYYVTQFSFAMADGWVYSLYDPLPTKWSSFGGAVGVCLAVVLAARATRIRPGVSLNLFAPIGALMLALARFGCFFLQSERIGFGAYMESSAWTVFPLTINIEYDGGWCEHYLAIFMLETLCAAVVALISALRFRDKRALRTAFYLCLTQIFCESLHEYSISWLFVRVEQLFCMLTLAGIIIAYIIQTPAGTPKRLLPLWVCIGCAALFVGIEFALDKSSLSVFLLYGLMLAGLAVLAWAEHDGFRRMTGVTKTAA